ncbi:biotin--[acetyl-CoA-carboxylase] ligase [Gordonibacter sp. An230]|uniref:biotin--[acetyl-CoA-carboxylase] ligase n=1 Tax=Gordonibacter sp. An230 TaxID=1965592 RepID=UPI000B554CE0|nr:biotin--[acetyl-CoA-carboxylase] ligase [Gordonibacter sp. An230]OUO89748.1 biotin--[acetyl-CoA-carboxylase] ligase [Gordonibacter sp. An230]
MSGAGGGSASYVRGAQGGAWSPTCCARDAEGDDAASFALSIRSILLDEVSSTNDEVKRALGAGEAEGLVVRALRQTGGYGRQGRAWASPEGGLYCSLLLRPRVAPSVLPTLSLVVGMAVRNAVAALTDAPAAEAVRIKWPNDVVVDRGVLCGAYARVSGFDFAAQNRDYERFSGSNPSAFLQKPSSPFSASLKNRSQPHFCACDDADDASPDAPAPFQKLCGISCEAHGGGVCVGVGVNVVPPAERPDVGGKNEAAYVAEFAKGAVTVDHVFDAFLVAFSALYARWQRDGFAPFVEEYNARSHLIGSDVTIEDRSGTLLASGTVARVDACGRLVLRSPGGAEFSVSSGEAHVRWASPSR